MELCSQGKYVALLCVFYAKSSCNAGCLYHGTDPRAAVKTSCSCSGAVHSQRKKNNKDATGRIVVRVASIQFAYDVCHNSSTVASLSNLMSSTSNLRVAFSGITGGMPRGPYAYELDKRYNRAGRVSAHWFHLNRKPLSQLSYAQHPCVI
jgi:hypothetical protein